VVPSFLIEHHHDPDQCGAVFAAWNGFDSPLRGSRVWSSCRTGDHRMWFVIDADDEQAALLQVPRFVAARSIATYVNEVILR
jgi:hypothetical protein